MRYLMLYRLGGPVAGQPGLVDGLIAEMARAGVLLAADAFPPAGAETRVRICGGGEDFEVTDAPAVRAAAPPAGYAIVQVNTRERAIELAKRFLAVAGDPACEIRLLPA